MGSPRTVTVAAAAALSAAVATSAAFGTTISDHVAPGSASPTPTPSCVSAGSGEDSAGSGDPAAAHKAPHRPTNPAGWRIAHTVTIDQEHQAHIKGVTATGPQEAWAVGFRRQSADDPEVQRWNGQSWSTVDLPGSLRRAGPITSSSGDNVWVAASENTPDGPYNYQAVAMRWDGARWTCSVLGGYSVNELAALSPHDVWAVGRPWESGKHAMHWDGAKWQKVPTSVHLSEIAGMSSNDVWALHDGSESAANGMTLRHWDGADWGTVTTPAIEPPPNGLIGDGSLHDVAVLPSGEVWAAGHVRWHKPSDAPFDEDSPRRGKALLLHWDGEHWSSYLGREGESYSEVASDGAGGVWLTTGYGHYVHHAQNGVVTRAKAPMPEGADHVWLQHLTNVPGTTCMIAAANPGDDMPTEQDAVIEAYGPSPDQPGDTEGCAPPAEQ